MKSDLLVVGNHIFDSIADTPFRGYIEVLDGKILQVGRGEPDALARAGARRVIEAKDRLIMAGFHDSHTHLLMSGLYCTYPGLTACESEAETVQRVKDAADAADQAAQGGQEGDRWVYGFGWYHVFWDDETLPTKASLDAVFPDRPVLLINAEAHGAWVNSKALEICGITAETPDPFGGTILRDADGEPTGMLVENAVGLITAKAFAFSEEAEAQLILSYLAEAAAYGITSVNDVQPYFHGNVGNLSVYSKLDTGGLLTARIHAAPDLLGDLDEVLRWQKQFTSDKLKVDLVKTFIDGVSTTHTALMLEDYADAPGNRGTALYDLDAIKAAVPEAHRRGLSVKIHSCGDASLRLALDYYENAIALYGKNACRHAIEHCEIVDAADIPRFGTLGVIPSVQPEHIALTSAFAYNPYPITLGGRRASRTWPLKSLLASAGVLAFGSDCPVVVDNPYLEIYRAVTRTFDDGEPQGGWNPSEKLTLAESLRAYTRGSAYGVRREAELGTLEAGKFADIIVVDRNLFAVSEADMKTAKTDITIMDGKVIFERKDH
jgi:predicted amidohydrolase YtcJ